METFTEGRVRATEANHARDPAKPCQRGEKPITELIPTDMPLHLEIAIQAINAAAAEDWIAFRTNLERMGPNTRAIVGAVCEKHGLKRV